MSVHAHPDPYDAHQLRAALEPEFELQVLNSCSSTNALLMAREPAVHPRLIVTEAQTAGRGRRGRRWRAAPGEAILFSLARPVARPLAALAGLSIAAGVALANTLRALGARSVALKWPNDLLLDAAGAKLGGILIETRAGRSTTSVVAGVGLNWRSAAALRRSLRRPVGALDQALDPLPSRNRVLAQLALALHRAFGTFEREGLAPFLGDWERLHAYEGRRLRVRLADGRSRTGIAQGIAEDGALILHGRGGVQQLHAGQVALARAA